MQDLPEPRSGSAEQGIRIARDSGVDGFEQTATAVKSSSPILQQADAGDAPATVSVVVQLQDEAVHATVRMPASVAADPARMIAVLRSELSWRGMTLGSLKLNGSKVWGQEPSAGFGSAADCYSAIGRTESKEISNGG